MDTTTPYSTTTQPNNTDDTQTGVVSHVLVGTSVTFSCLPGYRQSNGDATLTCDATGHEHAYWQSTFPNCTSMIIGYIPKQVFSLVISKIFSVVINIHIIDVIPPFLCLIATAMARRAVGLQQFCNASFPLVCIYQE